MKSSIPFTPSRYDSTQFLERKLEMIIKEKQEILDVGCGKLFFLDILNRTNKKVSYLGIDVDPKTNIKFQKNISGKIERKNIFSFKSKKKFNLIVCLWVLEHMNDDELAQKIMTNHLKKNGYLVIAVPSIWTWPLEFGRHGFHYYSLQALRQITASKQLRAKEIHTAGGLFGLIFTLAYNWPRFVILIPSFFIFKILSFMGTNSLSWPQYSKKIIAATWYRYHKFPILVDIHNRIVKTIVKVDNLFKLFPQSYIIILQKI